MRFISEWKKIDPSVKRRSNGTEISFRFDKRSNHLDVSYTLCILSVLERSRLSFKASLPEALQLANKSNKMMRELKLLTSKVEINMPTYNYNYKIGISDTTTFSTNSIVDTVVFPAGGFYENPFPKSAVFYEKENTIAFCLNNFTDPITNQTYAKYYTSTDGINWTPQNFDSHEGLINSNAVFSSLALMPTNKSGLAFTGSGSPFLLNNEPDFLTLHLWQPTAQNF